MTTINLNKIRSQIQKKHGNETLTTWNSLNQIPRTSTGSLTLDDLFGGGLPDGRFIQLFGAESSGKSAISLAACGAAVKEGHTVAYIDSESGFDPIYAKKTFNFDITNEDQVIFSQEDNAAVIYDMVEMFVNNGVKIIVIDSTDAMITDAEEEGDFDQAHMGVAARLNSLALKKLKKLISDSGSILILVSQVRMKLGSYGNPETTSGGNAIKFYSSIRARVSRTDWIKKGDEVIGQIIKIKTVKNKTSPPFREAEITLLYNSGIGGSMEIVNLAIKYGMIQRAGAWYTLDNAERFQGKEKVAEYFDDHPEFAEKVYDSISKRMNESRNTSFVNNKSDNDKEDVE